MLTKLTVAVLQLLYGEKGQTLAEYSLIMAAISVAVVVASVILFRQALIGAFQSATNCLDGC